MSLSHTTLIPNLTLGRFCVGIFYFQFFDCSVMFADSGGEWFHYGFIQDFNLRRVFGGFETLKPQYSSKRLCRMTWRVKEPPQYH